MNFWRAQELVLTSSAIPLTTATSDQSQLLPSCTSSHPRGSQDPSLPLIRPYRPYVASIPQTARFADRRAIASVSLTLFNVCFQGGKRHRGRRRPIYSRLASPIVTPDMCSGGTRFPLFHSAYLSRGGRRRCNESRTHPSIPVLLSNCLLNALRDQLV
jgi:hypothetical protein